MNVARVTLALVITPRTLSLSVKETIDEEVYQDLFLLKHPCTALSICYFSDIAIEGNKRRQLYSVRAFVCRQCMFLIILTRDLY